MAGAENITVLFTDLVGSTEIASRLAPDQADTLRQEHFSSLRQAISSTGGTEVKNLGDGLMVVFATASAALSCAVEMQRAVDWDNRRSGRSLRVRVGLSGGEATREGDDYFGDPVVEAARLCTKAEGGQILASALVRATAGRRSAHPFRPVGELELKGLPDPIATVEVGWEPVTDTGSAPAIIPIPARLALRPGVGVIGRDRELEVLTGAMKRMVAGEGRQVVLLTGEAGVGKTTLAAALARTGFEAGACVLLGSCKEDLGSPYQPFTEALGHFVSHVPEGVLRSHVRMYGSELDRMVPALGRRLGALPASKSTDADTERYMLFGATMGILQQGSAIQPLVVILDDLQWADKPSLQLLRHVMANLEPMRLLLVGIYRDSDLSASNPLVETLAALRREPDVSRIELKGLDDAGVLGFLEAAAGHPLDDTGVGLAHALYRETDGNPFFVGELLRHLSDAGAIAQDESGRWIARDDVNSLMLPDSVREVIGARVARLGASASQVLSLASVIGRDFDLELLARVTARSEIELLDVLDAAAAAALVRELSDASGHYAFTHALIQHTLYDDLGVTRRSWAHRSVGEAMETMYGERPGARVGDLAYHWFSAIQPIDLSKALSYSQLAAEASLAALAPDEALRYYGQALQLHGQQSDPDPLLGVDLLIGLGTAQRQAGVSAFRETLLDAAERARKLGAIDRLVVSALANNRGLFSALGVIDTEKVTVLEAVLAAMPRDDSNERALLLATLCNELTHGRPLEERHALANEAKDMARRLGDPATIVRVLNLVEQALESPPTLEERVADTIEALTLAEELDDPVLLYFAAVYRRISALESADFATSVRCLDLMRSLSERLQQPILMWVTKFHEAAQALFIGDPERAEALSTEALQIGTDCGQPDAVTFYGSQLLIVRHQQGRLRECVPMIAAVASEMSAMPYYLGAVAAAKMDAGDEGEALALLESASVDGFETLPMGIAWLDGLIAYCEVAIELRAVGPAAQLHQLLAPYHRQVGFNGLMPHEPVSMYLGALASVLGHYDEADAYFVESTELNTSGRRDFAQVRTDLAWGRMLADRGKPGDRDRARELLEKSRSLAATRGYATVEHRAAEELSSLS